jgi:hypothetical protein
MNLQIAPLVKIKYQYDTNIKEGHPIDVGLVQSGHRHHHIKFLLVPTMI